MVIFPDDLGNSIVNIEKVEDFPAPFGPNNPNT